MFAVVCDENVSVYGRDDDGEWSCLGTLTMEHPEDGESLVSLILWFLLLFLVFTDAIGLL